MTVKIIHVITTICRGGAETQLLTLVREQVKQGKTVSVIYLKGEPELQVEFEKAGAEVISTFANMMILRQIIRIVSFTPVEGHILHAHLPRAEIVSAIAKKCNSLIVSKHNAEQFFPKSPRFISKILAKIVNARANKTIYISRAVRDFLKSIGEDCIDSKASVVYYGFSTSQNVVQRVKNTDLNCTIGTIARLAKQKSLHTLLEAFAEIRKLEPQADLVIVGRGPERDNLIQKASELNIGDVTSWIPFSSNVYIELSKFDFFVLTSNYEGFGLVLLEAMQAGVPIVASRNSAIPEVLGENYPFMFETGNVKELLNTIKEIRKPENYAYAQSYLHKRLQLFSPNLMEENISNVYLS